MNEPSLAIVRWTRVPALALCCLLLMLAVGAHAEPIPAPNEVCHRELSYLKTHASLLLQEAEQLDQTAKDIQKANAAADSAKALVAATDKLVGNVKLEANTLVRQVTDLERSLVAAEPKEAAVLKKETDKTTAEIPSLLMKLKKLRTKINDERPTIQSLVKAALNSRSPVKPSAIVSEDMAATTKLLNQSAALGLLLVTNRLGGGSFGTVYRVVFAKETDPPGKPFAFKTFKNSAELETELGIYQRIGPHKNIAASYGKLTLPVPSAAQSQKTDGLAMELFGRGDVETLAKKMADQVSAGVITVDEKLDAIRFIFLDILQGLDAVHKAGLIACDLKELNAMMDDNYVVKLIDMGAAVERGQKVVSQTAQYADAINQANANPAIDMWSAGQMLYRMVQGDFFYLDTTNKTWAAGPYFEARWIIRQKDWVEKAKVDKEIRALKKLSPQDVDDINAALNKIELAVPSPVKDAPDRQKAIADALTERGNKIRELLAAYRGKYPDDFVLAYFDFQNGLLHPVQAERLTPFEALHHPFLVDFAAAQQDPDGSYRKMLFQKIFDDAPAKALVNDPAPARDASANRPELRRAPGQKNLRPEPAPDGAPAKALVKDPAPARDASTNRPELRRAPGQKILKPEPAPK